MQNWLLARVQATPQRLAIQTADHQRTFIQLAHDVQRTARVLRAEGIQPGDRIALVPRGTFADAVLIQALFWIGATLVAINSRLTDTEQAALIERSQVRLRMDAAADYSDGPAESFVDDSVPVDVAAPAVIMFTSGTSGTPKGVVLSYGNLFYSALASAYRVGHLPTDRWLCTLPLYHVGGLSILVRATLYGIPVELHPRFDAAQVHAALRDGDVSLVSLVPTMLHRLLKERREPWSNRLRLVLLGGAATSPALMQQCIEEGIPVATTYGLTEASSQVATTLPGDAVQKPGTVGRPLMFTEVRVIDEDGSARPPDAYGEVIVRGPTVMRGYDRDPAATARTLRDGWLHTGDIGYLDEDGDLFLVQRRSDLIVTGGENVYPAEVENALQEHPAVEAVAVVGIDDPEWGQRVAAAVVLLAGATLNDDELETFARQRLAGYKIPRLVRFVETLPQTASGKIARAEVRAFFSS